ncbi:MAG: hypothetical protein M3P85_05700 [Actinomycetota bacterium]|nr:hypothetical protein [Actinomycetota bacterium]
MNRRIAYALAAGSLIALLLFTATELLPSSSPRRVITRASPSGSVATLEGPSFGYNGAISRGPGWEAAAGPPGSPTFLGSVAQLRPNLLRYPGGTGSNFWHWQEGVAWDGYGEPNNVTNTLVQFANAIDSLDARGVQTTPIFVVNMLTRGARDKDTRDPEGTLCPSTTESEVCLADQIEMLSEARRLGLPVRYLELGNEFYLEGPGPVRSAYVQRFPTGADYAREAQVWVRRLKSVFPGVKVAVVGAHRASPASSRRRSWNEGIRSVFDAATQADPTSRADGFVYHLYKGSGLRLLPGFEKCGEKDPGCLQRAFDHPDAPLAVLSMPQRGYEDFKQKLAGEMPAGARAWVTEFNLFDRSRVVGGTWAAGLFAATQHLLFLDRIDDHQDQGAVEIATLHNLVGPFGWGQIFRSADGFKEHPRRPGRTPLFGLTASGFAERLVGKAVDGAETRQRLSFSNNAVLSVASQEYPALQGWVFENRAIILNLSSRFFSGNFSKLELGAQRYSQVSGSPRTQVVRASDLDMREGKVTGALDVPPYSITVLE